MSLNKFGYSSYSRSASRGAAAATAAVMTKPSRKYTQDGNIDAEDLIISNVKLPMRRNDATNKLYVDTVCISIKSQLEADMSALKSQVERVENQLRAYGKDLTELQQYFVKRAPNLVVDLQSGVITDKKTGGDGSKTSTGEEKKKKR